MACGLDIGTMFIVGSRRNDDEIEYTTQRNCFLDIGKDSDAVGILNESGAKLVTINDKIHILGEDAIVFSNLISSFGNKSHLQRPMKDGLLNSQEEADSISIITELIKGILGTPKTENEVCVYSCPSNPLNSDKNNVFHKTMFAHVLKDLGYDPVALNEALSVVYSENPTMGDMPMSGIGISFGAGQVNICMALRGYPVIEFSLVGSGDEIDRQVAILSGQPESIITKKKEKFLDFDNIDSSDIIISGLEIYYSDLLTRIIQDFVGKFSEAGKSYEHPIEIVITGGTASPNGFGNKFNSILEKIDTPFEVKEVRLSEDMLKTVSKGCLIKALREEKKVKE